VFILDVDGVMTTGQFFYTKNGKFGKIFGPDDHDALSLIKEFIEVRFITGDKKGFDISKRRIVKDMKFRLDLVSTVKRVDWIKKKYKLEETIYMGDGIMDIPVMEKVGFAVAVNDAHPLIKKLAHYTTLLPGGFGAVRELTDLLMLENGKPLTSDGTSA
ncbi:MAG: HAD hydrolase family protein, partial [Pseudomonadota bacterium]|nr:HAD hydrolase family protein [Pseudomonadota bacterium]